MENLIQKLEANIAQRDELLAASQTRELTADEAKNLDTLKTEAEKLQRSLDEAQKLASEKSKLAETRKAYNAAPSAPAFSKSEKRDIARFNFARACEMIIAGKELDGVEREAAQEGIKQARESSLTGVNGVVFGSQFVRRDMTVSGGSPAGVEGGYVVETAKMGPLDLLMNRMVLQQAGATFLPGMVGNFDSTSLGLSGTAVWETETSDADELSPTVGKVSFQPRRLTAFVEFSKQLKIQAPMLEGAIIRNLTGKLAEKWQSSAIYGSGGNLPTGILSTSGIGSVASSASLWADIVKLETEVEQDDAAGNTMAYLSNAKATGKLKTTFRNATYGDIPVLNDGQLNGYRYLSTNGVPSTLDTNKSAIIFGDFSKLYLPQWDVLEVLVDDFSAAKAGKRQLIFAIYADAGVVRPQSFAAIQDLATS